MNRWIRTRGVFIVTIFLLLWLGWMGTTYWIGRINFKKDIVQAMAKDVSLFNQFQSMVNVMDIFKSDNFCTAHIPNENHLDWRNGNTSQSNGFRSIALIKVYKAASSTLSNILYRYGFNRNMDFILPQGLRLNQIFPNSPGDPEANIIPLCTEDHIYQVETIAKQETEMKYQILNVHAVFRGKSHLHRVLPNDTFILSSVRDPVRQIKSSFSYNGFEQRLKEHNIDFKTFFESPHANTVQFLFKGNGTKFLHSNDWGLWNPQSLVHGLKDFGIRPGITRKELLNDREQMKIVEAFLESVDKNVDFSVIAERFEESIIIMKNLLDLEWEDVLYFESNKGMPTSDHIERKLILDWNYIDFLLYEKMKEKFYTLTQKLGKDLIANEVETLKKYNERIANVCLSRNRFQVRRGKYVKYLEFQMSRRGIRNECCQQMTAQEWNFIPRLKQHMWKKCEDVRISSK